MAFQQWSDSMCAVLDDAERAVSIGTQLIQTMSASSSSGKKCDPEEWMVYHHGQSDDDISSSET